MSLSSNFSLQEQDPLPSRKSAKPSRSQEAEDGLSQATDPAPIGFIRELTVVGCQGSTEDETLRQFGVLLEQLVTRQERPEQEQELKQRLEALTADLIFLATFFVHRDRHPARERGGPGGLGSGSGSRPFWSTALARATETA